MSGLLLPANVVREIQKREWAERRAELRAALAALFDFEDPVCAEWNPLLGDLDARLRLGRARPLAYEPGLGVIPGFYHWVRDNETAPPTVTPITSPDGAFREPDSGVLGDLRSQDLHDPTVFLALLAGRRAKEQAAEREREAERAERRQEITDRYLAGTRVQVSLDDSTPWAQNAAGLRRRG